MYRSFGNLLNEYVSTTTFSTVVSLIYWFFFSL